MTTPSNIAALREDLRISAELCGHPFEFFTTWGLFSPRGIDAGTALLLRYIDVAETDDCIDLGCGYGAIGLTMARLAPRGETLLLDKDFVAVEYAGRNAEHNAVANARALLSNGFAQAPAGETDVIATNLPAKSGKELYRIMFHDGTARLRAGGRFYVVSLNALRHFVARELTALLGNCRKLKTSGQYTVSLALKSG